MSFPWNPRAACAKLDGQAPALKENVLLPLYDNVPCNRYPIFTRLIILANVAVFFYEISLPKLPLQSLILHYGLVPDTLTDRALRSRLAPNIYLNLLSFQFLHGGWIHIIGNMWYLWIFGDNIEDRLGPLRFLVFYLACGVISGLVQLAMTPGSHLPIIGASGAIAGVLGAYLVSFPGARVKTLVPIFIFITLIDLPAIFVLGMWFVIQLLNGMLPVGENLQPEGVAYWAHVGGFLGGILLLGLLLPSRQPRSRSDYD